MNGQDSFAATIEDTCILVLAIVVTFSFFFL